MPKNIVLCSDGTGNVAVKNRGTNVFKLFEAIDLQRRPLDLETCLQIAFYDDGVGTQEFKPLKLFGGAFGWGLARNVQQLYTELTRVYEPGDRIYLFGFSRGAFTVRTLAGIISQVGIVDRRSAGSAAEVDRRVKLAFQAHRTCYQRWWSKKLGRQVDTRKAEEFREKYAVKHEIHAPDGHAEIEFVGVWDTVDALGFPVDEIADFWNAVVYPFKAPDQKLSHLVKRGVQAMAIDDERYTFFPVLWDERGETTDRIEQVWFSGVHSNVGGGYPKQGMSLVVLDWMMKRAEESGLRFLPSVRQLYRELENVNDKLYDPRAGLASYYRYRPRNIADLCQKCGVKPKIHLSVVERIALGTDGYSPGNLPNDLEVVSVYEPALAEASSRAMQAIRPDLLSETRTLVAMKRACHSVVVGCTLVMLTLLIADAMNLDSFQDLTSWEGLRIGITTLPELASWRGLAEGVKDIALGHGWVLAVLAAVLGLTLIVRKKINATYAEFWFGRRSTLRRIFETPPKADAARS